MGLPCEKGKATRTMVMNDTRAQDRKRHHSFPLKSIYIRKGSNNMDWGLVSRLMARNIEENSYFRFMSSIRLDIMNKL